MIVSLMGGTALAAPRPGALVTAPAGLLAMAAVSDGGSGGDELTPLPIEPSTSSLPVLPGGPVPSVDAEEAALAERPVPGVVSASAVVDSTTTSTVEVAGVDLVEATGSSDLALYALEIDGMSRVAVASDEALLVQPIPADSIECYDRAKLLPLTDDNGAYNPNLLAQMTHEVFQCVTSVAGFTEKAATSTRSWDGAGIWGFETLAEQVAAESVVVSYCESIGYDPSAIGSNNQWGYGGVFQMGATEIARFGFPGASKFDPVDNAYAAAVYYVAMDGRSRWAGWGPWAVVNTGYNDEVNDRVKVPVLPRFTSTDPDYRGRRGVELPAWAVDPWSFEVPSWGGCPTTGRAWPAALSLTED